MIAHLSRHLARAVADNAEPRGVGAFTNADFKVELRPCALLLCLAAACRAESVPQTCPLAAAGAETHGPACCVVLMAAATGGLSLHLLEFH